MSESLIDLAGLSVEPEEFLGAVLATTEQPIWVVDRDAVIRFANPAAIAALGYDHAEELSGRDSHSTIHYKRRDGSPFPADECPMLLPLTRGQTIASDLDWFVRRDGSMFPVSYVSVPIETGAGRGAVIAFTDIEDRLRVEELVREHDGLLAAQQESLRRVAALVAAGAPSADVFAAVAREVGQFVGLPMVAVWRFEDDDTATVLGAWSDRPQSFEIGSRWPLDGPTICRRIRDSGRPERIDDFTALPGTIAEAARKSGIRSCAGAPIVVDGVLWGAMSTDSFDDAPLPDDVEGQLAEFTELAAATFSTTARQDELARLADEQAALRRVATLVAQGVPAADLFAAVTEEVGRLLGTDAAATIRHEGDVMTAVGNWTAEGVEADTEVGRQWPMAGESLAPRIQKTGRPARIDNWQDVPGPIGEYARTRLGLSSSVGSPILVEGRVWGNLVVHSTSGPLPADTESRLAGFAELVATAIANSEAQAEVRRLADEQAALRRVATLVAEAVPQVELFGAVVAEVGGVFEGDLAGMIHYEDDGTISAMATWAAVGEHPPVAGRWSLEGDRLATTIFTTGRPTREDDWGQVAGPVAAFVREQLGVDSSVGSPVIVEGEVWGALFVHSTHGDPLPHSTEDRLTDFTKLLATAVSNSEARSRAARLADEQAALRRVATLVARGVPPRELFGAVAEEVDTLLGTDLAGMVRFENDETATPVATWATDAHSAAASPLALLAGAGDLALTISKTGRPARVDDHEGSPGPVAASIREEFGICSSVGSPIAVEGQLWGALFVHSTRPEPPPADTEARLLNFTELVATAISNSEARAEVERLANEQAGLRRVATLVALGSAPADVFAAVGDEVRLLLLVDDTAVLRYEDDRTVTVLASSNADLLTVGDSIPVDGDSVTARVRRTGRPARLDDYSVASGGLASKMRDGGVRSAVGAPITVGGRLWGVIVAARIEGEPLRGDSESRIGEFTELVATAISNVQAWSDLAASRARIVEAADDERRRVVRDLHDGAQQRLVHTIIQLKLAKRALARDAEDAPVLVGEALDFAEQATAELRELAHGILPAVLTRGGLRAGVEGLTSRMPIPVENGVFVDRLPPSVEATAYFVVAEALTNVAKHSNADNAAVTARIEDGMLAVEVRDDGTGGARAGGHGLLGMHDRLAVLDGRLRVESPVDGGTLVVAMIPLRG